MACSGGGGVVLGRSSMAAAAMVRSGCSEAIFGHVVRPAISMSDDVVFPSIFSSSSSSPPPPPPRSPSPQLPSSSPVPSSSLPPSSLLPPRPVPELIIRIPSRVEVLWPLESVYYRGTVVQHIKSSGRYVLLYDGGDVEKIDLSVETFRVLGEDDPSSQETNPGDESASRIALRLGWTYCPRCHASFEFLPDYRCDCRGPMTSLPKDARKRLLSTAEAPSSSQKGCLTIPRSDCIPSAFPIYLGCQEDVSSSMMMIARSLAEDFNDAAERGSGVERSDNLASLLRNRVCTQADNQSARESQLTVDGKEVQGDICCLSTPQAAELVNEGKSERDILALNSSTFSSSRRKHRRKRLTASVRKTGRWSVSGNGQARELSNLSSSEDTDETLSTESFWLAIQRFSSAGETAPGESSSVGCTTGCMECGQCYFGVDVTSSQAEGKQPPFVKNGGNGVGLSVVRKIGPGSSLLLGGERGEIARLLEPMQSGFTHCWESSLPACCSNESAISQPESSGLANAGAAEEEFDLEKAVSHGTNATALPLWEHQSQCKWVLALESHEASCILADAGPQQQTAQEKVLDGQSPFQIALETTRVRCDELVGVGSSVAVQGSNPSCSHSVDSGGTVTVSEAGADSTGGGHFVSSWSVKGDDGGSEQGEKENDGNLQIDFPEDPAYGHTAPFPEDTAYGHTAPNGYLREADVKCRASVGEAHTSVSLQAMESVLLEGTVVSQGENKGHALQGLDGLDLAGEDRVSGGPTVASVRLEALEHDPRQVVEQRSLFDHGDRSSNREWMMTDLRAGDLDAGGVQGGEEESLGGVCMESGLEYRCPSGDAAVCAKGDVSEEHTATSPLCDGDLEQQAQRVQGDADTQQNQCCELQAKITVSSEADQQVISEDAKRTTNGQSGAAFEMDPPAEDKELWLLTRPEGELIPTLCESLQVCCVINGGEVSEYNHPSPSQGQVVDADALTWPTPPLEGSKPGDCSLALDNAGDLLSDVLDFSEPAFDGHQGNTVSLSSLGSDCKSQDGKLLSVKSGDNDSSANSSYSSIDDLLMNMVDPSSRPGLEGTSVDASSHPGVGATNAVAIEDSKLVKKGDCGVVSREAEAVGCSPSVSGQPRGQVFPFTKSSLEEVVSTEECSFVCYVNLLEAGCDRNRWKESTTGTIADEAQICCTESPGDAVSALNLRAADGRVLEDSATGTDVLVKSDNEGRVLSVDSFPDKSVAISESTCCSDVNRENVGSVLPVDSFPDKSVADSESTFYSGGKVAAEELASVEVNGQQRGETSLQKMELDGFVLQGEEVVVQTGDAELLSVESRIISAIDDRGLSVLKGEEGVFFKDFALSQEDEKATEERTNGEIEGTGASVLGEEKGGFGVFALSQGEEERTCDVHGDELVSVEAGNDCETGECESSGQSSLPGWSAILAGFALSQEEKTMLTSIDGALASLDATSAMEKVSSRQYSPQFSKLVCQDSSLSRGAEENALDIGNGLEIAILGPRPSSSFDKTTPPEEDGPSPMEEIGAVKNLGSDFDVITDGVTHLEKVERQSNVLSVESCSSLGTLSLEVQHGTPTKKDTNVVDNLDNDSHAVGDEVAQLEELEKRNNIPLVVSQPSLDTLTSDMQEPTMETHPEPQCVSSSPKCSLPSERRDGSGVCTANRRSKVGDAQDSTSDADPLMKELTECDNRESGCFSSGSKCILPGEGNESELGIVIFPNDEGKAVDIHESVVCDDSVGSLSCGNAAVIVSSQCDQMKGPLSPLQEIGTHGEKRLQGRQEGDVLDPDPVLWSMPEEGSAKCRTDADGYSKCCHDVSREACGVCTSPKEERPRKRLRGTREKTEKNAVRGIKSASERLSVNKERSSEGIISAPQLRAEATSDSRMSAEGEEAIVGADSPGRGFSTQPHDASGEREVCSGSDHRAEQNDRQSWQMTATPPQLPAKGERYDREAHGHASLRTNNAEKTASADQCHVIVASTACTSAAAADERQHSVKGAKSRVDTACGSSESESIRKSPPPRPASGVRSSHVTARTLVCVKEGDSGLKAPMNAGTKPVKSSWIDDWEIIDDDCSDSEPEKCELDSREVVRGVRTCVGRSVRTRSSPSQPDCPQLPLAPMAKSETVETKKVHQSNARTCVGSSSVRTRSSPLQPDCPLPLALVAKSEMVETKKVHQSKKRKRSIKILDDDDDDEDNVSSSRGVSEAKSIVKTETVDRSEEGNHVSYKDEHERNVLECAEAKSTCAHQSRGNEHHVMGNELPRSGRAHDVVGINLPSSSALARNLGRKSSCRRRLDVSAAAELDSFVKSEGCRAIQVAKSNSCTQFVDKLQNPDDGARIDTATQKPTTASEPPIDLTEGSESWGLSQEPEGPVAEDSVAHFGEKRDAVGSLKDVRESVCGAFAQASWGLSQEWEWNNTVFSREEGDEAGQAICESSMQGNNDAVTNLAEEGGSKNQWICLRREGTQPVACNDAEENEAPTRHGRGCEESEQRIDDITVSGKDKEPVGFVEGTQESLACQQIYEESENMREGAMLVGESVGNSRSEVQPLGSRAGTDNCSGVQEDVLERGDVEGTSLLGKEVLHELEDSYLPEKVNAVLNGDVKDDCSKIQTEGGDGDCTLKEVAIVETEAAHELVVSAGVSSSSEVEQTEAGPAPEATVTMEEASCQARVADTEDVPSKPLVAKVVEALTETRDMDGNGGIQPPQEWVWKGGSTKSRDGEISHSNFLKRTVRKMDVASSFDMAKHALSRKEGIINAQMDVGAERDRRSNQIVVRDITKTVTAREEPSRGLKRGREEDDLERDGEVGRDGRGFFQTKMDKRRKTISPRSQEKLLRATSGFDFADRGLAKMKPSVEPPRRRTLLPDQPMARNSSRLLSFPLMEGMRSQSRGMQLLASSLARAEEERNASQNEVCNSQLQPKAVQCVRSGPGYPITRKQQSPSTPLASVCPALGPSVVAGSPPSSPLNCSGNLPSPPHPPSPAPTQTLSLALSPSPQFHSAARPRLSGSERALPSASASMLEPERSNFEGRMMIPYRPPSATKGILKRPGTSAVAGKCPGCANVQPKIENMVAFSRQQVQVASDVMESLLTELRQLRELVETRLTPRISVDVVDDAVIQQQEEETWKDAIDRAIRQEESARDSMMELTKNCNRWCRDAEKGKRRKSVVFADEAGCGELFHVRIFDQYS
ncbi:hypothetical protein CBR_g25863 [Chara braunii]|uniref:Uncharacterized protein n=1 Tax=Chara braunii TaxID=69332 RepID=A0A388L6R3_CHABU|nr:hypothetical protein CBR_g25863 [Chara braunii]|eukprot:GBG77932.1 hypothetical protein CBR_g25863 [Chara braunii]